MRKNPAWETVVIFLGIFSLWPAYILQRTEWYWTTLPYLALALLAIVFVRRLLRMRAVIEEEKDKHKPQL